VLTEFEDTENRVVHAKFQAWRRNHPDAFFLTFGSKQRSRLHAASCPHSGDGHWTVEETGHSLTTHRKVCADTQEVLLAWAARLGVEVVRCADCLRGVALPTKGVSDTDALTSFSWGYWGWGNSVPQFLQAAAAHEAARGFMPPAFADVRLRRSGRAPGFNGRAF
jgi:hypothetical protein